MHTFICLLHGPYESITSDPIRLKSKISKEYHHHTTSGTTTKGCRVLRSMRHLYKSKQLTFELFKASKLYQHES